MWILYLRDTKCCKPSAVHYKMSRLWNWLCQMAHILFASQFKVSWPEHEVWQVTIIKAQFLVVVRAVNLWYPASPLHKVRRRKYFPLMRMCRGRAMYFLVPSPLLSSRMEVGKKVTKVYDSCWRKEWTESSLLLFFSGVWV